MATWLNRWPTSSRMKKICDRTPCKICWKEGCEDSIRHVAHCEVTQLVAARLFGLPTSRAASNRAEHLERFLCLEKGCTPEELRKRAIFLQVMYYFYLASKHGGPIRGEGAQLEAARFHLSRATRGVAKNTQIELPEGEGNWKRRKGAAGGRGP